MGYLVCMLDKTQMNGRYRDPYLSALVGQVKAAGATADVISDLTFLGGYVESERWIPLRKSGTAIRSSTDGWILRRPPNEEYRDAFQEVCDEFGIDGWLKLAIPQQLRDNRPVDTEDRIVAGARLLKSLISAGL